MRNGLMVTYFVLAGLTSFSCRLPLPTYPSMSSDEAVEIMRERSAAIQSISTPCRIILTDELGRSIELTGALVARKPGEFRLRAWKLTQVVFDLTVNADGCRLLEPDPAFGAANQMPLAYETPSGIIRPEGAHDCSHGWSAVEPVVIRAPEKPAPDGADGRHDEPSAARRVGAGIIPGIQAEPPTPSRLNQDPSKRSRSRMPGHAVASVTGGVTHLSDVWMLVTGDVAGPQWSAASDPSGSLRLRRSDSNGGSMVCHVAPSTLTIEACLMDQRDQKAVAAVRFLDYRRFDTHLIPTRIEAEAQTRRFTLLLDDVTINGDLPPEAFVPPAAAVRIP